MIARLVRYRLRDGRVWVTTLLATSLAFVPSLDAWSMLLMLLPVAFSAATVVVVQPRISYFEWSIPVSTHTVVAARLTSMLLPVTLPPLLWLLVSWMRGTTGISILFPVEALLIACLAVGSANLIAPHSVERPPYVGLAIVWLALGGSVWLLHQILAVPLVATVLGAACIAVLLALRNAVPKSFAVRSPAPIRDAHSVSRSSLVSVIANKWPWWAYVLWYAITNRFVVIQLALAFAVGALSPSPIFVMSLPMIIPLMVRAQLLWLGPLPLSSRQQFVTASASPLVLVILLFGFGTRMSPPLTPQGRALGVNAPSPRDWNEYEMRSAVPFAYWKSAPTSAPTDIESPWGERTSAYDLTVMGRHHYNPYSVGAESSSRFAEWQFARATFAVYGESMTRDEYQARRRNLPRRTTDKGVMLLLQLGCWLVFGFFTLWLNELAQWRRRHTHALLRLLSTLYYLPFFSVAAISLANMHAGTFFLVALLQRRLLELVSWMPPHPLAQGAIAIGLMTPLVIATFLLAEWQSQRAEPRRADPSALAR